ncbi:hypothetical protein [Nocardia amamiensis]|uniref:hypothetical protein n=1 Tax=Nocardia amamiensis TaxID=404578 RepID=UPI00083259AE|nr:hypothetical protein [Nocardia amamiensis]
METTTPEIPAYEMPTNPLEKKVITEIIKGMVCRQISDPATGAILDVRTCAALIDGDNVRAVRDPEFLRTLLDNDAHRAAILKACPNIRVYYARKPRKKKPTQ